MFAFLSKKIALPNGVQVNCIAWNSTQDWIACGGKNGMLKVLLLERMSDEGSNLSMNQTLQGHEGAVMTVCWNENYQKLTSSDQNGLIIVWTLHKGMWFEEMINNRNKSFVRDMKWDGGGMKICIVYEDGVIIVGSVDGKRLWAHEQKKKLTLIEWSPDGQLILASTAEGECYVYDAFGHLCDEFILFPSDRHTVGPLTCMTWHRQNSSCSEVSRPSLAFGFEKGLVQLMRDEKDRDPLIIDVGLSIVHLKWNIDGTILAIAGVSSISSDPREISKVKFYDPRGNLLHILRVPGKAINSIAWERTGSRFAMAVDSFVYFADIRPSYRWGNLQNAIVYSFTKLGREEDCVMFWNHESLQKHAKYIKNLIAICTAGDNCVLVSKSTITDDFLLILCDSMGTLINSTCVKVNPLFTAMTEQYMVVASQTCVYLWSVDGLGESGIFSSRVREEERKEHDSLESSASMRCAMDRARSYDDHICALAVSEQYVLIGMQSGVLECYRLPPLNNLTVKYKLTSRPRHMSFNCNSTKFGVIDVNSLLLIFAMDTESLDEPCKTFNPVLINHRNDSWDLQWSDDDPDLYAVMEKSRLYIFRGSSPEEPIISQGNICSFCDLRVTAVLLDEVMKDPERPKKEHLILNFETKSLRDMRRLLNQNIYFRDAVNFAVANDHHCLWRLLSKSALGKREYMSAYQSFVHCGDYHGVQLVKRLEVIDDENEREAVLITYFQQFEEAEDMYTHNNQLEHAINLRSKMGDWFKVEKLLHNICAEGKALAWIWDKIGHYFYERQKWARAAPYFSRSNNITKLAECLYLQENFTSLERAADRINEDCNASSALAHLFTSAGMCEQATTAYLHANDAENAISTCIVMNRWEHATTVAGSLEFHQDMVGV
mmetsp:Transcript_13743/g.54386  ORF Transcript_13743/g.54386 Transcript_13743/m.54386 type:complete len:887 (-) Transcript_13743:2873-5533(-)